MEGGGVDIFSPAAQHTGKPGTELSSRLIGEGDGKDIPRGWDIMGNELPRLLHKAAVCGALLQNPPVLLLKIRHIIGAGGGGAVLQEIGNPVNKHGGLTAAGTCQDEDRSFHGKDCFPLHGVEIGKTAVQNLSFKLLVGLVITLRHEGVSFFVISGANNAAPHFFARKFSRYIVPQKGTGGNTGGKIFCLIRSDGYPPPLIRIKRDEFAVKVLPSLDKDTHAFRRCKSALTASSSLAYASMPASSSLPSSDFPSPKSPVEFLRGRNAVGGSAAKMAGWRLPMNRAMPYGIYARKNRMCSCQAKVNSHKYSQRIYSFGILREK